MNPHEHELHYPWPDLPALGRWVTLRPGVHWIRMPLPFALDHINLWVLDDEIDGRAGYTLIDSGKAKVNQSGGLLKGNLEGEYDTNFVHAFNVNFVYRF